MRRMAPVVLLFLLTAAGPPREHPRETPQVRLRTGWYHIWVDTTNWTVHEVPLDTVFVTDTFWVTFVVEWNTWLLFGDTGYVDIFCPVLDTTGAVRDTLRCLEVYVTPVDSSARVLEWYFDTPWDLPRVIYDTLEPWWDYVSGIEIYVRFAVRVHGALYFTDYARFPGTWIARARFVDAGAPAKQGVMGVAEAEDSLQVVDNYVNVQIVKNGQETLRVFERDTLRIRYQENTFTWLRVELWEDSLPVREGSWVLTGLGHTSGWRNVILVMDFGQDIGAVYKVRVVTEDLFGNRAKDSVWVAVVPDITVTLSPNPIRPYVPANRNPGRNWAIEDVVTLSVTVRHPRTGAPVDSVPVEIRLQGISRTGDHNHDLVSPSPPLGSWIAVSPQQTDTMFGERHPVKGWDTLLVARGRTGTNGKFEIQYHRDEVAGLRLVKVLLGNKKRYALLDTLIIRFDGFAELGSGEGYTRVGATASHPKNHYGRPYLLEFIRTLARRASQEIQGEHLYVNDMSLPWGGVFDVCGTYDPRDACRSSSGRGVSGHEFHRTGEQVDLSGNGADGRSVNHGKFVDLMKDVVGDDLAHLQVTLYWVFHNAHYHVTIVPRR